MCLPPGEHSPGLGLQELSAVSVERLGLHEEQVLKRPGDVCGSVFQPGECVAQRKWIILAGSPADDFPNESGEDASFPLQGNMTWD